MPASPVRFLIVVCGAAALVGGCTHPSGTGPGAGSFPASSVTPARQQVGVTQPQQLASVSVVPTSPVYHVVASPPPPARTEEAAPPRPSPQHIWIEGHWSWSGDQYEWEAGHWKVPPPPAQQWINPRWEPAGDAFHFYEGRWQD